MTFRNATVFMFPADISSAFRDLQIVDRDGDSLQAALAEHAIKPVGPTEVASAGFASPYGEENAALYQRVTAGDVDVIALTVASEKRLLPSAAVNKALTERIKKFEAENGRKPGGKMRRRMKDDLLQEMLPKAFVQPGRTDLYIDLRRHMIVINTASRNAAEKVVSEIRRMLGSFPALPVNCEVAPRQVMTGWIAGNEMPELLSLGDECELRDPADSGAIVKIQRMQLAGEEIDKHLEAGKQVAKLGVVFADQMACVIDEGMVLRKATLMDGALDVGEADDSDDVNASLDAQVLIMAAAMGTLIDCLSAVFKWSRHE